MPTINTGVDDSIDMWNTADPVRRRALIDRATHPLKLAKVRYQGKLGDHDRALPRVRLTHAESPAPTADN